MFKGVIFDMDGVLIDSQPFHFYVDNMVLKACGVSVDERFVERFAGTCTKDRMPKYIAEFGLDKTDEQMLEVYDKVIKKCFDEWALVAVAGIPELLTAIREKGLRLAVASSSSMDFITAALKRVELFDFFDEIVSGEHVAAGKPAPDVFLCAAERLGFTTDECVVVEDSSNGVLAAYNAKIKCIGYINVTSGNQDLSKADIITDSFLSDKIYEFIFG